jgi:hypothetical protein
LSIAVERMLRFSGHHSAGEFTQGAVPLCFVPNAGGQHMESARQHDKTPASKGVKNRRKSMRFPADVDQIAIVTKAGLLMGTVIDESYGGIGIVVSDASAMQLGQELELLYSGAPLTGTVRRIVAQSDGTHTIGIQWVDSRRRPREPELKIRRSRTTHFVAFGGLNLACQVLERLPAEQIFVRLASGRKCEALRSEVARRTLRERRSELDQMDLELTMLVGLYQLGPQPDERATIEAILDFEFGPPVA